MLESLTAINFQKHRKTKIEFAPGVTTLVGETNAGKSTLVRALRSVCLNETKAGYVRHGKKAFTAILQVDGQKVKRKKGDGVNVYVLGTGSLRAFGREVPKGVADLLGISGHTFQRQFDSPFWFTETPGAVARSLNEIVDLAVIDKTLAAVTKESRDAKAVLDVTRQRLQEARVRHQELKWVPEMVAEWGRVEIAEAHAEDTARESTALAFLIKQAQTADRTLGTLTTAHLAGANVVKAGEVAVQRAGEVKRLKELIAQAKEEERYAALDLPDFEPLLNFRKKADTIAEDRRNLDMLVTEAQNLEEEICRLEKELKGLSKALSAAVCPKCGQFMDPNRARKSSSQRSATCTSHYPRQPSENRKGKTGSRSKLAIWNKSKN